MTSKRTIVTTSPDPSDRRARYTLPVVREIPADPPDPLGAQSLW